MKISDLPVLTDAKGNAYIPVVDPDETDPALQNKRIYLSSLSAAAANFEPYDPAKADYNNVDPSYVSDGNNVYQYINANSVAGKTPATQPIYWKIVSAGQFAHIQNTDLGTSNDKFIIQRNSQNQDPDGITVLGFGTQQGGPVAAIGVKWFDNGSGITIEGFYTCYNYTGTGTDVWEDFGGAGNFKGAYVNGPKVTGEFWTTSAGIFKVLQDHNSVAAYTVTNADVDLIMPVVTTLATNTANGLLSFIDKARIDSHLPGVTYHPDRYFKVVPGFTLSTDGVNNTISIDGTGIFVNNGVEQPLAAASYNVPVANDLYLALTWKVVGGVYMTALVSQSIANRRLLNTSGATLFAIFRNTPAGIIPEPWILARYVKLPGGGFAYADVNGLIDLSGLQTDVGGTDPATYTYFPEGLGALKVDLGRDITPGTKRVIAAKSQDPDADIFVEPQGNGAFGSSKWAAPGTRFLMVDEQGRVISQFTTTSEKVAAPVSLSDTTGTPGTYAIEGGFFLLCDGLNGWMRIGGTDANLFYGSLSVALPASPNSPGEEGEEAYDFANGKMYKHNGNVWGEIIVNTNWA